MSKAGNGPLTEALCASLAEPGQPDSLGTFTLDPEIARERIRSARFANPLRYVLELVQAAVQKGATNIAFRFATDGMHMYFDGDPFVQSDFDELYTALLLRATGKAAQARRLLSLGLCTALQLEPALVRVESGDTFLELRPGEPDRRGTLDPLVALTHIELRYRLHLGLLKRYVDHLGGQLTEEVLLKERCVHARVLIEIEGKRISEGYVLPDVSVWRTFADNDIAGVVGIAPVPSLLNPSRELSANPETALPPAFLRLIKNGVWVDTQLPIELLPGFRALAECSTFRLDIAREHVIQDQKYAAVLRAIAGTQVDLLATLCRLHADGQLVTDGKTVIEASHLRALLRGLLWRLGGLGPLLRWSGLSKDSYPPGSVSDGSALWPAHVVDGAALLTVPVFQSTLGEPVPLSRLLADFAEYRTVAYSAFRSREPDFKRPLVLYVAEAASQDLLRGLFGGALECRDGAMAAAWERERNRVAWLRRAYRPRLTGQALLGRAPLSAAGITGEVGIEPRQLPRAPWERPLHRPPALRLLLVKEGCLLVEKNGPFAVPGLIAAASGNFTPNYLYDDVMNDARLGAVIDAVLRALPSLVEQVANAPLPPVPDSLDARSTPPLDPHLRGRAAVLRGLLMLTLSSAARAAARSALGVARAEAAEMAVATTDSYDAASVDSFEDTPAAGSPMVSARSMNDSTDGEIPAHLLWVQLRDWPLFETIDGLPLRPRDLEEAALRHGYVAVLCASPTLSPKRLERYAKLCQRDGAPAELWQKVHSLCVTSARPIASYPERPPFVLFLSPIERPLRDVLLQQLPPTRIIDAEPWLRAVSAMAAVHAQKREEQEQLPLPESCAIDVPLLRVEGRLGVVEEAGLFRAFAQEPRIHVALLCKRHQLGTQEIYLPGGQFLSAVADHAQLHLDDDLTTLAENGALAAVRTALGTALPSLIEVLVHRPLPWPPLVRLVLLELSRALFPRPAFRRAYDALRELEHEKGAPISAESDYARLLQLAVATSLDRVEVVLDQGLAAGSTLHVDHVIRDVLSTGDAADPAFAERRGAVPPEGAMAFVDALYPLPMENPTFAERALRLLPALESAPLFAGIDGAPLTLGEVIADFTAHGQVLFASVAPPGEVPPRRPVVFDPSALVLPILHCLFGEEHVREVSGHAQLAAKPLSTLSWPPLLLEESSQPHEPPLHRMDSNEERLRAAVVKELRELGAVSEQVLRSTNLAWLEIDDSDAPLAVVCDAQHFIINRRHPAVKLALSRFAQDPQCVRFLASAAYTALSARLEAGNHDDASHFYQHLGARALAATQPEAPRP